MQSTRPRSTPIRSAEPDLFDSALPDLLGFRDFNLERDFCEADYIYYTFFKPNKRRAIRTWCF